MSGGRATVRGRKGKDTRGHHGDIVATDDDALPFLRTVTVEVKRGYNAVNLSTLLDGPPPPKPAGGKRKKPNSYHDFIAQARAAATGAKTPYWMLVHKRDRREPMAFVPWEMVKKLCVFKKPEHSVMFRVAVAGRTEDVFGCRLYDLLERVKPLHFKKGGPLWTPPKKLG
jgi:hypothetical protein